ncbi:patatin-like phospholipase family protein [Bradyrhizobium liaoningense]|uniref:patatin-like phospholipase family protein n=1 Tax=Bradyrhizobium liaoningense TaxID=43992 RepID=UPI001BADEB80|nr:patatin-like phospholipase family protein [Bradyrhizobium liaoningense]MBR1033407.1 patatin-like phospholipase family protein [Bradyrhizobium liaoningense]
MAETSGPDGITLCLSGGGLRATYFHLGVIWALRTLGRLKEVKKVYSVSGGSIAAAHLAVNWGHYTGLDRDAIAAAQELVAFAERDVRGRIIRRTVVTFFFPLVNILLRVFGKTIPTGRTDFLEAEYRALFDKATVSFLRVEGGPEFFVLGTTLLTGGVCVFSSGGYSRGNAAPYGGQELPLAKAVAASSAFPPLFPPARILAHDVGAELTDFNGRSEDLVTDGGVFDNLGYDMVHGKQCAVIICDASARFDLPPDRWLWGIISRTSRATDILMKRVGDKTLQSIENADNVTCIQIGKRDAKGGVLTLEAEASVARIRTDLDRFNAFETSALILNGFRNALHELSSDSAPLQAIPFLRAQQISNDKLVDSGKRTYWSFGLMDWATYVVFAYIVLFLAGVTYLPLKLQREAVLRRATTPTYAVVITTTDTGTNTRIAPGTAAPTPSWKTITVTDTPKYDAPADQRASQTGFERASVRFENRAGEPVLIYWTDFGGNENQQARLQPGQLFAVETYVGHLWLAKTTSGKAQT